MSVFARASPQEAAGTGGISEPYRENALADHPWKAWAEHEVGGEGANRMPGGQSRWSQGKDLSWEPLRPELVVEVAYEHMQGAASATWRSSADGARIRSPPMHL